MELLLYTPFVDFNKIVGHSCTPKKWLNIIQSLYKNSESSVTSNALTKLLQVDEVGTEVGMYPVTYLFLSVHQLVEAKPQPRKESGDQMEPDLSLGQPGL